MKLTNEQTQQFRQDGYAVVPGLISEAELAPIRSRLGELLRGEHDWPDFHFQVLDPSRFKNPKGGFVPVGVQGPAQHEDIFRTVADHPNLQAAMSQLLGGRVKRFTDQALIRNGEIRGGNSFYHQDSYYWKLAPETGCNVWITLNEVGPDAGALAIMPGTQQGWTLTPHEDYYDEPVPYVASSGKPYQRHRIPLDRVDFSKEVLLPMQSGDAVFFSNFTWHRSERNLTGETEYAYAIAYQLEQDQ